MSTRNGISFKEFWAEINGGSPPEEWYYVYKLYDEHDELIYVGKTRDVRSRLLGHWNDAGWLDEVKRIEVEEFLSRHFAEEAEKEIIHALLPRHNRKWTGRPYTPGGYMPHTPDGVEELPGDWEDE